MTTTMIASNEISAAVRSAFNFSIERFPLSGPDSMKTPWYGLFRSDTGEVVGSGSVSDRYVPHQTDDVLALVDAAAAAFDGVQNVSCYFRDGHRVSIMPSQDYRRRVFGTADSVFPRGLIDFGYDLSACVVSMGYFRDLCRNLHIMRRVSGTTVRIRHTSGLRDQMDDLIQSFSVLRESWGSLANVIENYESRRVNMVEFLNAVYPEPESDSPRATTIHRNRTEAIFRRLSAEMERSGRGSVKSDWMVSSWMAFNAIQGYVQHEATRKGSPSMLSRAFSAMDDAAVARAETLALEMSVAV